MNFKSLLTVFLATATLAISAPIFSQTANPSAGGSVSFSCQNIFEPGSETKIPATVAWVPQRSQNVPIVYWKSEFFSAADWNPQARCEEVTPKFQANYDSDRLNYLTNGMNGPYPVICAAITDNGEICNGDNQLFQLKRKAEGNLAIAKLMNIFEGGVAEPLYQNSGSQAYVSFNEFLLKAPAIEEQNASN